MYVDNVVETGTNFWFLIRVFWKGGWFLMREVVINEKWFLRVKATEYFP